jgi:hypothetical protein
MVDHLRLSKGAAFRRVTAARLLRRLPIIGDYLEDGRLSLTKLCHLKNLLSEDNVRGRLDQAAALSEQR